MRLAPQQKPPHFRRRAFEGRRRQFGVQQIGPGQLRVRFGVDQGDVVEHSGVADKVTDTTIFHRRHGRSVVNIPFFYVNHQLCSTANLAARRPSCKITVNARDYRHNLD